MAGGIDWFRWHHGTSGDRKFPLVAKRAGARVGDVIAMWAILLEQASASEDRGHPGHIDFEAIDLALDLAEGMAQTIHAAMTARGLIDADTGRLVAWERRQPKRERPDDHSTERSRAHRAMQRHATPDEGNATPCNANVSQETPRGEESREEEIQAPTVLVDEAAPPPRNPCPTDRIIALYHEHLPMLSRVEVINDARRRSISARWKEVVSDPDIRKAQDPREAALEFFAWFFGHVATSPFLTGKSKDWRADIDFLMTPTKFARVVEGSYHKEHA